MATPKNNSVLRAFDILNAFTSGPSAMTAGEVASALGLNLSTAHRFLLTLEEIGAVARLPGNRYHLGMMMAELGRRVTRHELRVCGHHKRESVPERRRSERRSDSPGCCRCIEGPHLVGLK